MASHLFSSVIAYSQHCERLIKEMLHIRPSLDRQQVMTWVDEQSHAHSDGEPLVYLRALSARVRAGQPMPWDQASGGPGKPIR
ncbi:MAG: hypothetical protein PW845_15165 [Pseudomonas sp.]|uniref:hypothetical protein n=1 Tax=Pseudomonas abieticivorans TaxID=2931382 RepID=UPI0020C066F3|nr:hypothetical protein [Pseudomonas sp. PIA16]MDE1166683.1 hypothetical protein [Pseudomonas sp.]